MRTWKPGLALILSAGLVLVGCTNGADNTAPPAETSAATQTGTPDGGQTKVMEDLIGDVTVPVEAHRVAATAPAFTTTTLMLGGADKLVALEDSLGKNEWIASKYPQLEKLPVVFAGNETNMEELLAQKPDLVLFAKRYGEGTLKQLQDLNIAAVSGARDSQPKGYDHLNWVRDNQSYMGEAIGGKQQDKAKKFAEEFTATREKIEAKTKGLDEGNRPTVVQLSSAGDKLQANNGSAIGQELITLAGGVNAAKDAAGESAGPSGQTVIDVEQLMAWNPEMLLVDSPKIAKEVANDHVLSQLSAVQNNKMFVIPKGAMAWAYNGPEAFLAMEYFAKVIQPELFKDLDLEDSIREFYSQYFGFDITDEDLAHLLGDQAKQLEHAA